MDLPTCPSCGQSVIDDDVEDCPFCGESLSGKPSAKPKPPQKSAQKPAAKQADQKGSSPKSQPGKTAKKSSPESDDPFDVATPVGQSVIRLTPKPQKGRLHRVVCPMCDTQGFTGKKAAGKSVKCVNHDCLVPIFTAPEIQVKEPEPEPESSGMSAGKKFGIGSVLIILIGFGVWFFFMQPEVPDTIQFDMPKKGTANTDAENKQKEYNPLTDGPKQAAGGQTWQPAKMRDILLADMIETSRLTSKNRSKPFCRMLTAGAFAESGEIEKAQAQIEQLKKVGQSVPYYQIPPLVQIAWQQLKADDKTAAAKTITDMLSLSKSLPEFGRAHVDFSAQIAAVLIANGRLDDAKRIVLQHQNIELQGQLSAFVQSELSSQSYNLDSAWRNRLLQSQTAPQWAVVSRILCTNQRWDDCLDWAAAAPDIDVKLVVCLAFAEALVDTAHAVSDLKLLSQIDEATKLLPSASQAQLHALVSQRHQAAGQKDLAQKSLNRAKQLLKSEPIPQAFVVPEMKEILQIKLSDPVPFRLAALASAEISLAEFVNGSQEAAWVALQGVSQFSSGIGPSLSAIQVRLDEINNRGSSAMRGQLKRLLELENEDMARLAFNRYRRQCNAIRDAATARMNFQVSLYQRASSWNLTEQIWEEVQQKSVSDDINLQEPFFKTALPAQLVYAATESGNNQLADQIRKSISAHQSPADPLLELQSATLAEIQSGNLKQAAEMIEQSKSGRPWQALWTLRIACRLAANEKLDDSLQFVSGIDNPVLSEEALLFVSAIATKNGQGEDIWKWQQEAELTPTEKIALYRGLIAGLNSAK